MKKTPLLFLIGILCLALCACQAEESVTPTEPEKTDPPVTAPPATEYVFALDTNTVEFTERGQTAVLFSDVTRLTEITWSVDQENLVEIINGAVKALDNGTVNITATWNGQTAKCVVLCNFPPLATEPPATNPPPTDPPATNPPSDESRKPVLAPPTAETVGASFFDDAVFVGDSVSLKLSYYANSSGRLGNAKFLVQGSYGAANAVSNKLLMSWQGKKMDLESAVEATGAKKLFIMLGMNDIAIYGVDKTISNWRTMLGRILEKSPDIEIYIQSMTPIWTGGEKGGLNNKRADQFNQALETFALENGYTYIDVASYMKDSTGGLAAKYCSDNYVHITTEGAKAWVNVLRAFDGY